MTQTHVFELLLAWTAAAMVVTLVAEKLRLPQATAFTIGGMALALIPGVPAVQPNSGLIMLLFLPPLIQASAYFTSWPEFRAALRPILVMAIGATLFTTLAVAWAAKLVAPNIPWAACFALGAAVSPPDPVAAKAVLRRVNLPRRLLTVLEGEALMNDAAALVLYRFAIAAALTGTFNAPIAGLKFFGDAAAGIAIGFATAMAVNAITRRLKHSHVVTVLSFLAAWLSYMAADALQVSAILAVATCGLRMGMRQHEVLGAEARAEARAVWGVVEFLLEAAVFILIGLSLRGVLDRLGGDWQGITTALPLAGAVVAAVILSRFLWVFAVTGVPQLLPRSLRRTPPSVSALLVVSWAGMRGVVTLAAGLALPETLPGRDLMLFAVFAVILTTVLIQGATIGPLARLFHLRLPESRQADRMNYHAARAEVLSASLSALRAIGDGRPGETAADIDTNDMFPALIGQFERRAEIAARTRDDKGSAIAQGEHLNAWLQAVGAGRQVLVNLQNDERLHPEALHAIERELDLEEMRVKQMLERVPGAAEAEEAV
jgi:CPA1 family monovalent cation:H+ antiporter